MHFFKISFLKSNQITIMLCVSDAGEATVAYIRDIVPNEQRSAAKAGAVSDHSPPH